MAWTAPRTWVAGEVVTAAIGNTAWRDDLNALKPAYAGVSLSAAQTHTSTGNFQTINWDAEDTDSDAFHDTVTNNSRLTVPTGLGGVYLLFSMVTFASAGAGWRTTAQFRKNGATTLFGAAAPTDASGAAPHGVTITDIVTLAATDYVEVQAKQDSGGSASYAVGASGPVCRFGMTKIFSP